MSAARVEELREAWEKAIERDRHADAAKALVDLEKLAPDEPQWSQRLGEALRRIGKKKEAEDAFARAAERYMERGFVPRAVAMAKLVVSLNPQRDDLLARIEPKKPAPPVIARPAPAAPAPPVSVKPVVLKRADDSSRDEVRFDDVFGPSSLDIILEDVSDSSVIVLGDDDIVREPSQPPISLPVSSEPSIDRLGTMAAFRLFANLSRDALLELSKHAELTELIPNAIIIVKDEPAYALYAIVEGTVRVVVRGSPDIRLGEGEIIGEACLLDEGERQADVKAETAVMALRIEKRALDVATEKHEEIGEALFQLLARRLVMNLMQTSPLFTSFDPAVRLELAQMFEVRRAEPGTVLAERGKRSDGLYILLAGHVTADDGRNLDVRVARGSAFGHASLLGAMPADETVTATTEAVLLRLPAARFSSLAALYPPVLAVLAETADEPLRASRLPGD